MALFCVQSWLHQRFVAPFYQPLGGVVGRSLAAAALLVAALLLVRRTGAWRRLGAGIRRGRRRSGSRRRPCSAAGSCSAGLSAPRSPAGPDRPSFPPPGRGPAALGVRAAALRRRIRQHALPGRPSRGGRACSPPWRGSPSLIVSRRRLWETAWLAASARGAGGFHAQRFSRPLPDVGEPAVRPGGHAARQHRDRRRRRSHRGLSRQGRSPLLRLGGRRARRGGRLAQRRRHQRDGERARVARPDRLVRAFREGRPRGRADLYCDQPGFAAPLRFISGHRAYELPGRTAQRVEMLLALMRRKAAEGREVLYLSQQPFEDPPAQRPRSARLVSAALLDARQRAAGCPDRDETPRRRFRPLPGATDPRGC